jgi:hypothetical protein
MMSARTTIDHDLTCGGCGYNLRGLPSDGTCPECGGDVATALSDVPSPDWLRRLAVGSLLIAAGVLTGAIGTVAATFGYGRWLALGFPLGAIVAAVGTWAFATGEPHRHDRFGVVLRGAGALTVLLQLCVVLAILGRLPIATRHAIALCQATAVVWGFAAVLTCVRAAMLASRVKDQPGATQAGLLGAVSLATFFVGLIIWTNQPHAGIIPHLVLTAVLAGWSIVFFLGFSIVLRRRARTMLAPRRSSTAARPG